MNIIFFGTHNFAAMILKGLLASPDFSVGLVVTPPDKPAGRHQEAQKPLVKILAEKKHLPIIQPVSLKKIKLNFDEYDLGVSAQYGLLIPPALLNELKHGIINIHPSLLPKYRGASPLQSAILNSETKTGVTIMKMDAGLDTGPILTQKKIIIEPDDTYPILEQKMAQMAIPMLLEIIPQYLAGKIKPEPQDDATASYCHQLTREQGQIDWHKPAREIYNQWRALLPWPGVFGELKIKNYELRIKILKMRQPSASDVILTPTLRRGKNLPLIKLNKKTLGLMTGDGNALIIDELQPEGKRPMTAEEFINGYLR